MKHLKFPVMIMLAFLALVACKGNPEQVIPTAPIERKSNTEYAYACYDIGFIFEYMNYQDFIDKEAFAKKITDTTQNLSWKMLHLAFTGVGTIDSKFEDPYVNIDGEKLYLHTSTSPVMAVDTYEITNASVDTLSYRVDATTNTANIDVNGLTYTATVTSPAKWSETLTWDIHIEAQVESYEDYDGSTVYYWETGWPTVVRVILNNVAWPEYTYDYSTSIAKCGEEDIFFGYYVTLDTQGGNELAPYASKGLSGVNASDLSEPVKSGCIFKEWVYADGSPVFQERDYIYLTGDITIYASYYEDALPSDRLNEVFAVRNALSIIEQLATHTRDNASIQKLFALSVDEANKQLLNLALYTNGCIDSTGEHPYLLYNNEKYYGADDTTMTDGLVAGVDYKYEVDGTGSCVWNKASNLTTGDSSETRKMVGAKYTVTVSDKDDNYLFTVDVYIPYADFTMKTVYSEGGVRQAFTGTIHYYDSSKVYQETRISTYMNTVTGLYCDYVFDTDILL